MSIYLNLNPPLKNVIQVNGKGKTESEVKLNLRKKIEAEFSSKISKTEMQIEGLNKKIKEIKEEAKEIQPDSPTDVAGRLLRTIGLAALYILGIVTVIPAAVVVIGALSTTNLRDVKVIEVAHRYMTLKSQEQIDLEDEWEMLKAKAIEDLQNPADIKFDITGMEKPFTLSIDQAAGLFYNADEEGILSQIKAKREAYKKQIAEIRNVLKQQLFP
jgi:hypothetical protein